MTNIKAALLKIGPFAGFAAAIVLVALQVLVGKGVITADALQSVQNVGADLMLILAGIAPSAVPAIKAGFNQGAADTQEAANIALWRAGQARSLTKTAIEIYPTNPELARKIMAAIDQIVSVSTIVKDSTTK
jgi:hypothetical protein